MPRTNSCLQAVRAEIARTSLRRTAARLGYSPTMLSLVLSGKKALPDKMLDKMEAVLLPAPLPFETAINCPVLGKKAPWECRHLQTRELNSASPLDVKLYRACRNGCAHYQEAK